MVNILRICCQQRILNFNLFCSRKYSRQLLKNASVYCISTSSEVSDRNPSSLTFLRNVRTFSKNEKNKSKCSKDEENKNEENKKEENTWNGNVDVVDIKFKSSRLLLVGYTFVSSLFIATLLYNAKTAPYTGEYTFEHFLQKYLPTGEVKRVKIFPKAQFMLVTLQDGAIIDGKTVQKMNIPFKLDFFNDDPDNIIRRIREKEASLNISESERIPVKTIDDTKFYLVPYFLIIGFFLLSTIIFFKFGRKIAKIMAQNAKDKNDKKQ
uniref:FtsH_ext domain-containing protein n=1 Tax=Strongyloides venezuelensis TaxID=75913 RepID=A0A0K0G031_STRVS